MCRQFPQKKKKNVREQAMYLFAPARIWQRETTLKYRLN